MGDRRTECLIEGSGVGVFDVRCSAPAGGPGPEEHAGLTQVVLPIQGVFEVHRGRETVIADATSVVVFGAGHEHRVSHPATAGDRSMVMVFPAEVADEALDPRARDGGRWARPSRRSSSAPAAERRAGELEAEEPRCASTSRR
jgi:hypothetical protein